MITLHYLSNSHSHVILWLLEELGLECNLVKHQRDTTGRSPSSLRSVHPLAKAPTIEDHGITMVESTGIIMYILETYGEGRLRPPANTADAMRFYQWLTYIEGSAKAPAGMKLMVVGAGCEDANLRAAVAANLKKSLSFIESNLEGQDYLVDGMFTAADIQLAFYAGLVEAIKELDPYPNIRNHLTRMRQRDAYKRADQKGGPPAADELLGSLFKMEPL